MMPNNLFIMDFETNGLNIFDGESDFPIEIGVIVTDPKLNIQETYTSLIMPDSGYKTKDSWVNSEVDAYNIHKITIGEWVNNSITYVQCKDQLTNLANKYTIIDPNGLKQIKPIIISDNAVFETACIRQIFGNGLRDDNNKVYADDYRNYFHYSTWDTNVLLEHIIGDPIPVHRALKDCGVLYRNLVRAYDNLGWFGEL